MERWSIVLLSLLVLGFVAASLPHLSQAPPPDWAEMGIVAPAHKLASEGVYGNDLFTGFHRSELRNYEYMPAYPLLVALSFELFGLGLVQARAVSVLCGAATLVLTFLLGRRLLGRGAGLVAAGLLGFLVLEAAALGFGVPLLDFVRRVRYDNLVPVFVLAASYSFSRARSAEDARPLFVTGLLVGLATLSHLYGAFLLVPLLALLVWGAGWTVYRKSGPYVLLGGWLLALLPWLLYVAADPAAYAGQMSRHAARFSLFQPAFLLDNLSREYVRYAPWVGSELSDLLRGPRVGTWLLLLGLPIGTAVLALRAAGGERGARQLLVTLPLLVLQLGLLVFLKRYVYLALVLPFIALFLAAAVQAVWRSGRHRAVRRAAVLLLLGASAAQTALAIGSAHRRFSSVTPYAELSARIAGSVPEGSRLLISQPYWLGLREFESRSINLAYVLSREEPLESVMDRLAPDYVVVESYFFDSEENDLRAPGSAEARSWFAELGQDLDRRCGELVRRIVDADYGTVQVLRCADRSRSSR